MKILAYTESYAFESVTFILNELNWIRKDHDLMLCYSERINPDRYELPQMRAIPFKFNRVYNKLRWWLEQFGIYFSLYNRKFSAEINEVIESFKPDIVHCHFGTDFLRVFTNLDVKHRHLPMLISFYGFDATERLENRSVLKKYKQFLKNGNVFSIAVSQSLVENVNLKVKPVNSTRLLHSGIDTDFYKRKEVSRKDDTFVFLQVSSFYQRKGHKYTLIAFSEFISQNKDRQFKFIIAGFGPLENEIKDQVKQLGLSTVVEVRNSVTPLEMVELSSAADCFVHMSITSDAGEKEGLPNVLLEAMSLELPIVATLHAGIPEIVTQGENGLLCPERDVDAYVQAFNEIVKWKPLKKNREKIVKHFSLETHMKKLYDIYKEINGKCAELQA